MFRIVLAYLVVFGSFYFGINTVRQLSGREKLNLTKTIMYSIMCTILTVVTLMIFVSIF